jgi:phosphoribosyl-ATP pyrophosphohydrolase/phosphoribosyl-AMP cyclohydrolase
MSNAIEFIETLETIIAGRKSVSPDDSYTAQLFAGGAARIAQKLGEEGVELALASVQGNRADITSEAADLIYHLLVLLQSNDLTLADVAAELQRRHR